MRTARLLGLLFLTACPLIVSGQQETCLATGRVEVLRTQILNASGPKDADVPLQEEFLKSAKSIIEALQRSRLPGKEGNKAKTEFTEAQAAVSKRICS